MVNRKASAIKLRKLHRPGASVVVVAGFAVVVVVGFVVVVVVAGVIVVDVAPVTLR